MDQSVALSCWKEACAVCLGCSASFLPPGSFTAHPWLALAQPESSATALLLFFQV